MSENIREEIWDAIYKNQRGGLFSKDIMLNQILSHLKSQIDEMPILSEEQICKIAPDFLCFQASRQSEIKQLLIAQKQDIRALFSKEVKND